MRTSTRWRQIDVFSATQTTATSEIRGLYKYEVEVQPAVVSQVNGRKRTMLILWTLVITVTSAQKVFESTEDIGPEAFQNVTTLYPISDKSTYNKTTQTDNITNNNKLSNNDATNDIINNERDSKEKSKIDTTVWKIQAAFAESNLENNEKENITSKEVIDKKNEIKEFRPSPHLGNFYDEDRIQETPTPASFVSFTPVKKPSSGFVSSHKDDFPPFSKIPKQILQTHKQYPYKFESPILARAKYPWSNERPDSLESRPTADVPVKVPAGGFYKYEDPFKVTSDTDEDFGLGFNEDGKDGAVKKRVNPWENFFRLVTAFLPVGLIISALTPSIITIQNTGPGTQGNAYPSNVFRRSDPGTSKMPVVSESCRRRLLCELRSQENNKHKNSPLRGKQCYKIYCEDSEAFAKTMQWLLEYKRSINGQNT